MLPLKITLDFKAPWFTNYNSPPKGRLLEECSEFFVWFGFKQGFTIKKTFLRMVRHFGILNNHWTTKDFSSSDENTLHQEMDLSLWASMVQ